MNIAFIGLGNMGFPMACNLLTSGYRVTGFDLNEQALDAFRAKGGRTVNNLASLDNADVYITMLQTPAQVRQVYCGEEGLFSRALKGALFIDCSSIDVKTTKELFELSHEQSFERIDAPVSGGVPGAVNKTLTIMVGGTDTAFKRALPILETMGKNIIHACKPGCGQAAKICNNMILGISMAAISEAFELGEKLGLKKETLFDISSKSSGQCWSMTSYCPVPGLVANVPSNNDYQPGFSSAMMLKDLNLSQEAAKDTQAFTPLGEKAYELYQQFVEQGGDSLDFSAIITLYGDQQGHDNH